MPAITGKQCALIAPYESDPDRWKKLEWTNRYEPGSRYRITTDPRYIEPDRVAVRTLRDVFHNYRESVEAKSLGPDGKPCTSETRGLLRRRHVRAATIVSIGKEMNALEEHLAGTRQTEDELLNTYHRPGQSTFDQLLRPALRALSEPVEKTAKDAHVSPPTVKRARAGQPVSAETQQKLTRYVLYRARVQLRAAGIPRPPDHEALLAAYLDRQSTPDPEPQLCACGCGQPIPAESRRGRARKYIDETHRKRAQRRQE